MILITADFLIKHGAQAGCEQLARFCKAWPQGARPTLANCQRAHRIGLSLEWPARFLLPKAAARIYQKRTASARAAYETVVRPTAWTALRDGRLSTAEYCRIEKRAHDRYFAKAIKALHQAFRYADTRRAKRRSARPGSKASRPRTTKP